MVILVRNTWHYALSVVLVIIVGMGVYVHQQNSRAATFFSHALSRGNVSETVTIHDTHYIVQNGIVRDESGIEITDTIVPLRLAYAHAVTRRNPILGLAGTDPDALAAQVERLSKALDALAEAQENPAGIDIVTALYPIRFLSELAALEKRRQEFLVSGSDVDETRYRKQIDRTLRAYVLDLKVFETEFKKIIAGSSKRIVGVSGTVTSDVMEETLDVLENGAKKMRDMYNAYEKCLREPDQSCADALTVVLPPVEFAAYPEVPLRVQQLVRDNDTLVALNTSACAGSEAAPHYFRVHRASPDGEQTITYAGDLFFILTENVSGATVSYQREELGIDYSLLGLTKYYICPDVQYDRGMVHAIVAATQLAGSFDGESAAQKRLRQRSTAHAEHDAAQFVRDTLENGGTNRPQFADSSIEVARMLLERSAGFEFLIAEIARTTETDLRLKEEGVPFDIRAENLLLTHSAFPSLYLLHHPSIAGGHLFREHNSTERDALFRTVQRYSDITAPDVREKIAKDIHTFLNMEGILPNN